MTLAFACDLALSPGFAKPATIEEIAKHGHVLTSGRYVGAEHIEEDAERFAEKYPRQVADVSDPSCRMNSHVCCESCHL